MEYLRFPEQLPVLGTAGTLPLDRTSRLFYKDVGQSATPEGYERIFRPRGCPVDRPGQQILAGPYLARDEYRRVRLRYYRKELEYLLHLRAPADNLAEAERMNPRSIEVIHLSQVFNRLDIPGCPAAAVLKGAKCHPYGDFFVVLVNYVAIKGEFPLLGDLA